MISLNNSQFIVDFDTFFRMATSIRRFHNIKWISIAKLLEKMNYFFMSGFDIKLKPSNFVRAVFMKHSECCNSVFILTRRFETTKRGHKLTEMHDVHNHFFSLTILNDWLTYFSYLANSFYFHLFFFLQIMGM